ncbi:MAG: Holliday junction resolvase RuvX [Candidatus Enterosoma sp.]|nr:Holliday junction resolvase RuvX [Bacilli bacterium]MDY3046681.1 Holliday junction resolvase RuvX [Candidatus Enterosoma sp.]
MKKNLLALDLGKGSLGVAISRSGMFITPITNLRFHAMQFSEAIDYLKELLMVEKVETFVLGLPLFPSGDDCEMTSVVRQFAEMLKENFPDIEIVFQDERYSTLEASSVLHKQGQNSKKQHKGIDAAASCVILKRYLISIGQMDDIAMY